MLGSSQAINFSNNKKNAYDLENIFTNSESENILAKKKFPLIFQIKK